MAKISEILAEGSTYSYEFFPPKDDIQAAALEKTIGQLAVTDPDFISVTYGALGNTRETTRDIVITQNARWSFPAMAHLTCVAQSRSELTDLIDEYAANDVENILALRGDGDQPGDFAHAIDLTAYIKDRLPGMTVGVAAHPEVHPDSPGRHSDRDHLVAKLEVADFAITQFFFEAGHYRRLVNELGALGNNKPIIPGIMLFTSADGLRRMSAMNNTSLPPALAAKLGAMSDPADTAKLAIETAAELIDELRADDVPGVHIYTLNKSGPALELKSLVG
jgi:methylenetetrahydrofolate reductase (NADPH)